MQKIPFIEKWTKTTKKIKCPSCGTIVTISGRAQQRLIVTCPQCSTKGYFEMPNNIAKKSLLVDWAIQSIIILFIVMAAQMIFITNELLVFLVFICIIPVFFLLKYDGKILMVYASVFLVLSMVSVSIYNNQVLADDLIIYVYWLLVVSVLCQFLRFFKSVDWVNIKKMFG